MSGDVLSRNIHALRKHLGLNQTDFGARVGSAQANVSKWESGTTPDTEPLEAMAALAGCSISAFKNNEWRPPQRTRSDHSPTRTADGGETTDILQLDLSLSMGPGTLIDDFVGSELVKFDIGMLRKITRAPFDRLRFVTGIGDSHEPKFHHSDQFLIDINERQLSRIDGYYWITLHGAHALKRLRPAGNGQIEVHSDNPTYGPQVVDAGDIRIEGRAVWVSRGL
jgi:phage repressor protein C with HTH and peptisase S24 domain